MTCETQRRRRRSISAEAFQLVEQFAIEGAEALTTKLASVTGDTELAQDAVQTALATALLRYDRARQASGEEGFEFSDYVWTIAINEVRRERRRVLTRTDPIPWEDHAYNELPVSPVQTRGFGGSRQTDPVAAVLDREERQEVGAAFRTLSSRQQMVLYTLVTDGPDMSYAEMATSLEIPPGSIGPTRQRALRSLATAYTGKQVNIPKKGHGRKRQ